jgi:hypothetical protein
LNFDWNCFDGKFLETFYMGTITRNLFLRSASLAIAGLAIPKISRGHTIQDKPAPMNPDLVKEFVTVCHGQFDRVKTMLEENHLLLHVSHDWGGGDFESGIEAAGHVGNNEIANYLLQNGARYNIYLASMLGHFDIVKQVVESSPQLLNSKGPHGFTMLHHAKKGGEQSLAIVNYLESKGAKETKIDFYLKP